MRIVINGHKDSLNNGNMLMVLGLIEEMRRRYPDVTFFLLSDLPHIDTARYSNKSNVIIVKRPWSKQQKGAFMTVVIACCYFLLIAFSRALERITFNRFTIPKSNVCQAYANADIAVDVSGDDMTSAYGWIAPVQVLFESAIARLFGVKTVFLAHSIGPFNTWYMKIAALGINHFVDYLTFRDEASYFYWKNAGSPQRQSDRSASYPYSDLAHLVRMKVVPYNRKGVIAVNISNYVISNLLGKNDKRPNNIASREVLKGWGKLLAYIQAETGCQLLLLPHTFRPGIGDDRYWHKLLQEELIDHLRLQKIDEELTTYEVQRILNTSSFVIASRMHLALTSWRCGIPFLSLAYSHKYRQLAFNVPQHISPVIPLYDIPSEKDCFLAIQKRFDRLWDQRDEVSQNLISYRKEAEKLSSKNIEFLSGIIDTQCRN